MSPEQLKQIAEYMGHESWIADEYCKPVTWAKINGHNEFYNPLTNPEQLLELIELLLKEHWCEIGEEGGEYHVTTFNKVVGIGKTLAEAVCKAVLEMIENKE